MSAALDFLDGYRAARHRLRTAPAKPVARVLTLRHPHTLSCRIYAKPIGPNRQRIVAKVLYSSAICPERRVGRDVWQLATDRSTLPDWIIASVARKHCLLPNAIRMPGKHHPVSVAKQEAAWRLREEAGLNLSQVAGILGWSGHTTARQAIHVHAKRYGLIP